MQLELSEKTLEYYENSHISWKKGELVLLCRTKHIRAVCLWCAKWGMLKLQVSPINSWSYYWRKWNQFHDEWVNNCYAAGEQHRELVYSRQLRQQFNHDLGRWLKLSGLYVNDVKGSSSAYSPIVCCALPYDSSDMVEIPLSQTIWHEGWVS